LTPGGGQGGLGRVGDHRPVLHRNALRIGVELHLRDGVAAVLADQAGAFGGPADRDAVLVGRPAGSQLGDALLELGPTLLELCTALGQLGAQPRDARVLRVGLLELRQHRLAGSQLPFTLGQLGLPLVDALLAGVELHLRVGELGLAGVELVLRLERVDDPADVRDLTPCREDVLDGGPLGGGEGGVRAEHDRAEPAGSLRDLLTELLADLLEVGSGDGEPVAQRLTDRGCQGPGTHEDDEPEDEHAPGVGGAPAAESVQGG
jgi:hypothetical protein